MLEDLLSVTLGITIAAIVVALFIACGETIERLWREWRGKKGLLLLLVASGLQAQPVDLNGLRGVTGIQLNLFGVSPKDTLGRRQTVEGELRRTIGLPLIRDITDTLHHASLTIKASTAALRPDTLVMVVVQIRRPLRIPSTGGFFLAGTWGPVIQITRFTPNTSNVDQVIVEALQQFIAAYRSTQMPRISKPNAPLQPSASAGPDRPARPSRDGAGGRRQQ